MKTKKKHHSRLRAPVDDRYGASMYLRLCHRCLYLNEGSQHIEKCQKCESRFTVSPSFEKNFDPSSDFPNDEDPIQEALNDFESEKNEGNFQSSSESQDEPSDDSDTDEDNRNHPSQPISGLSVLW